MLSRNEEEFSQGNICNVGYNMGHDAKKHVAYSIIINKFIAGQSYPCCLNLLHHKGVV